MIKGTLVLISSKHDKSPLRTDSVEGIADSLPTVGQYFELVAEPLVHPVKEDQIGFRYISTSEVVEVNKENDLEYRFETKNSMYFFRIQEETK